MGGHWSLVQTVAPASEPVTLAEAKLHCRVTLTDDDTLIQSLITAAREVVERVTNRQLFTATWRLGLEMFPEETACPIVVPKPLLQSVSSITYVDTAGATQTLATTVYGVDTASQPGRVYLNPDQSWPSTYEVPNAILITYVAGWSAAASIPEALKSAIKLLVAHWYENREATVEKQLYEIPLGVERILWLYRIVEFY